MHIAAGRLLLVMLERAQDKMGEKKSRKETECRPMTGRALTSR